MSVSVIDVRDYGAVLDGVNDDTAAIQAAQAAQQQLAQELLGPPGSGFTISAPTLYFASGIVKTTAPLSLTYNIFCERTIFQPATQDFQVFIWKGGMSSIRGGHFLAGKTAIYCSAPTLSECMLNIFDCDFDGQVYSAIDMDLGAGGMMVNVTHSRFIMGGLSADQPGGPTVGGHVAIINCDTFVMTHCSIAQPYNNDAFVIGQQGQPQGSSGGDCHFKHILAGGSNDVGAWFKVWSANLLIERCRFGGEDGGKLLVDWYPSYGELIIKDTPAFHTNGPHVWFHGLPDKAKISGMDGYGLGVYFDAAIPATDIEGLGYSKRFWMDCSFDRSSVTEGNAETEAVMPKLDGGSNLSAVQAAMAATLGRRTSLVSMESRVCTVLQNDVESQYFGATGGAQGFDGSGDIADGPYGDILSHSFATVEPNSYWASWTPFVGTAPGIYTLAIFVRVEKNPINIIIFAGATRKTRNLVPGSHIITEPFNIDSGATLFQVGFQVGGLAAGSQFAVGNMRVFSGHVDVDTYETWAYGATLPTTGRWIAGDRLRMNGQLVIGQPLEYVCIATGRYADLWQPNTNYVSQMPASYVQNQSGQVYRCTTSGMSGSAGPPTGTGSNIHDGSTVWTYIEANPVWRPVLTL